MKKKRRKIRRMPQMPWPNKISQLCDSVLLINFHRSHVKTNNNTNNIVRLCLQILFQMVVALRNFKWSLRRKHEPTTTTIKKIDLRRLQRTWIDLSLHLLEIYQFDETHLNRLVLFVFSLSDESECIIIICMVCMGADSFGYQQLNYSFFFIGYNVCRVCTHVHSMDLMTLAYAL